MIAADTLTSKMFIDRYSSKMYGFVIFIHALPRDISDELGKKKKNPRLRNVKSITLMLKQSVRGPIFSVRYLMQC